MFSAVLDSLLLPTLGRIGGFKFLVIFAFVFTVITTIIYKYMTDQTMMKHLKSEMKRLREQMKQHKHDQKKVLELNAKLLAINGQMIQHQMWPMVINIIPAFILLPWLNAHLAYMPLTDGTQFMITADFDDYVGNATLTVPAGMTIVGEATQAVAEKVNWRLSGKEGTYIIELSVGDKKYYRDVIISERVPYAKQAETYKDGIVNSISINYKKKLYVPLPFWNGWLATYLYLSILFTTIVRKVLDVH